MGTKLPFPFIPSENGTKDYRFGPQLEEKALEEVGNTEELRICHSPVASIRQEELENSHLAGEE